MSLKRLTHIQRLEREIAHLQRQLGRAGVQPHTIEQVILRFSIAHGAAPEAGQVISAPSIVRHAQTLGLTFKATSVSAILCRMACQGLVKKAGQPHNTFHTYTVR